MKTRVLIADDHAMVRQGLCGLLSKTEDIEVVGEAADGIEAIAKVKQLKPDVVLMDIAMPNLNGLEAMRQLSKKEPTTKVIALTIHDSEQLIRQIIWAGASGYVLKQSTFNELATAIRTASAGGVYLSPPIAKKVVQSMCQGNIRSQASSLTPREREILCLIAQGKTNKEIAEALYLSLRTVQTHRDHLMKKIGAHERTELLRYALREGLITL